jgi:hypothetical protein
MPTDRPAVAESRAANAVQVIIQASCYQQMVLTAVCRLASCSGIIMFPSMDVKGFMTRQQVLDLQGEAAAYKQSAQERVPLAQQL